MKIQLLPKRAIHNGEPVKDLHFTLFTIGRYHVGWHPHVKCNRYGTYWNKLTDVGLKGCLNLPLLGDFSLWMTWINPNTKERPCPGCGKPFVPNYSSRFEQYSRICDACAWLNMEMLMKSEQEGQGHE